MFDGSNLDVENNIKLTRKYVNIAHKLNVAVEGEIGVVGGQEDDDWFADYAKLEEIELYCKSKTRLFGCGFWKRSWGIY